MFLFVATIPIVNKLRLLLRTINVYIETECMAAFVTLMHFTVMLELIRTVIPDSG